MPTITENHSFWSHYDWQDQGDEWSQGFGGTEYVWWSVLYPRIAALIPTGSILELAPGYGRFSQYLKDYCEHLTLVDLTEQCIVACRERFASDTHISYHINDGKSLDFIPDHSIDFVFSYDSLVHVEYDVLEAYLTQLGQKLTVNGVGLFHHSTIGSLIDQATGSLPFENIHWRATSMTAERFVELCSKAGLVCIGQETLDWGGQANIDCISMFTRPGSIYDRPYVHFENSFFATHAFQLQELAKIYSPQSFPTLAPTRPRGPVRHNFINEKMRNQLEPVRSNTEERESYTTEIEQQHTSLWHDLQTVGKSWETQSVYIEQLEQQRNDLWQELQKVGKSWETQSSYIADLERQVAAIQSRSIGVRQRVRNFLDRVGMR